MGAYQIDLFESQSSIPELPDPDDIEAWRKAEKAMFDEDQQFPVESIKIQRGTVHIRHTCGIWCWGVTWNAHGSGEGFSPLRKWGRENTGIDRASCISSASEYIAEKVGQAQARRS